MLFSVSAVINPSRTESAALPKSTQPLWPLFAQLHRRVGALQRAQEVILEKEVRERASGSAMRFESRIRGKMRAYVVRVEAWWAAEVVM